MGERNIPRLLGVIAVVCIAVALVIITLGWPGGGPGPEDGATAREPAPADGSGPSEAAANDASESAPAPESGESDSEPDQPLHDAAARGDVSAIRAAIADGARVDAPYRGDDPAMRGLTPLMIAARYASAQAVAAILEAGPDVAATDDLGRTALMHAASSGDLDKTELLVTAGSALEAKSSDGRTTLMFAAEGAGPAVVALLLDAGADARATDASGRSAADIGARRTDDAGVEVARILREAGRG